MAEPRDLTRDLELHRQVLEDTVTKLTASLHHWQQWYIEYASLQEEVTTLPTQPPTRKDLARIKRDFESEILTKQEVNEIFGKNDLKPAEQIVSVLDRRLDYVERNVETLRSQLEAAENKLAASRVLADPDEALDEESGLPITDIIEEIDEDGNVLDFRLHTPGVVGEQVLEALKKAGVEGFGGEEEEKEEDGNVKPPTDGKSKGKEVLPIPTQAAPTKKTMTAAPRKPNNVPASKKSVSFAEETKTEDAEEDEAAERERLRETKRREALMETAMKEQDEFDPEAAIIPVEESEEDAQLRREMLEYSTQEIGPIVAELELDEGATDDDDYDFEYTDEEDEDEEDELGRSKYSVITDDYVKRMQELEKRLGVESAFAVDRAATKTEVAVEGLGRISVQEPSSRPPAVITEVTEVENKPKAKKGVRFATELDIADESAKTIALPERPAVAKKEPEVNPIGDVMERTSKPAARPVEAPTKKPSRFKKDRAAGTPALPPTPFDAPVRFLDQDRTVAPSGPEGKTLADAVSERDVSSEAKEPDELNATLLHQEAALEYHRMRNRLIQKQGGFGKEEEAAITPLDEEEGGQKKMSRFKAARLSRQGL